MAPPAWHHNTEEACGLGGLLGRQAACTAAGAHEPCIMHHLRCALQLAQAKAMEIEGLLERLADINARMGAQTSGVSDTQAHTLANHLDKLADYQQVCLSAMVFGT